MANIERVYVQDMPAVRFIGKRYGDDDRVHGGFGAQWQEWMASGWFRTLEAAAGGEAACHALFEDSDAYLGLMRHRDGEPFQYWIGLFVAPGIAPPEGFEAVDFPASRLGVVWLKGAFGEVFGMEYQCAAQLVALGYRIRSGEDGATWFFERYACPRFTEPDAEGRIILDICHFLE